MSWLKVQFLVDAKLVDSLNNILETFLAQAITTENAGDDEFYEVAFPGTPDWQTVYISALFAEQTDVAAIIEFVQTHLNTDNEIPATVEKLIDQDWERVWLDSFKPIQVGQSLWVCPSWCKPTDPQANNIILDPGLAFGTGTHPTTHLCLQWLSEQNLENQTVVDYGSGSGILALGALLNGAIQTDAIDIDPLAVSACKDNAARNSFSDKLTALLPNELALENRYNLVIANILADVIIDLKHTLLSHLENNGVLLLTGILSTQAERVKHAFSEQLSFEQREQEQWCLLIGIAKE